MIHAVLRYLAKNYSDGTLDGVSYNAKKTVLTLTKDFTNSTLNLADFESTVKNVNASALKNGVKIVGNALNNSIKDGTGADTLSGGKGNDNLVGGDGKDTLNGGAGNDSLNGGDGADVFVYSLDDGNDIITNYAAEDKISLTSGAANVTTSGNDIIFTVGTGSKKGTITVRNGNGKTITYIEDGVEQIYPKSSDGVKFNNAGTAVTLTATYEEDSFNIADYDYYKNKVATIKASAVKHSLEIVGNKNANKITSTGEDDYIDGKAGSDIIYGGKGDDTLVGGAGSDKLYGQAGNDSLWGGAGSDTLFGGDGSDTFVYKEGDGYDVIDDYTTLDKIRVLSGDVGNPFTNKAGDVTFEIGDGQLVVKGGADKYIPIHDKGKNILVKYNPR